MQFDDKTECSPETCKAQRRYLDAVNQYFVALQAAVQDKDQRPPADLLQQLAQAAAGAFAPEDYPVFNNLLLQSAQVNAFYQAAEKFFADSNQREDAAAATTETTIGMFCDYIDQQCRAAGRGHAGPAAAIGQLQACLHAYWQTYWQEFVHSACSCDLDQGFEQQLKHILNSRPGDKPIAAELNALLDLWREYIQALGGYEKSLGQTSPLAISKYRTALTRLAARKKMEGEPVDNVKTLYHLWIECHDDAYREIVFTDQHAKAFAKMVNSLMRLRKALNDLSTDTARSLHSSAPPDMRQPEQHSLALQQAASTDRLRIDDLTQELDELKNLMQTTDNKPAQ